MTENRAETEPECKLYMTQFGHAIKQLLNLIFESFWLMIWLF